MPPWAKKKGRLSINCSGVDFSGAWLDVDHGECQRCKTERRLYQPDVDHAVRVCALCAMVYSHSAMSNADRSEEDEAEAA